MSLELARHSRLFVRQSHELGEWIGIETRNKYRILDESGRDVAFAAEQQKGLLGLLLRQVLGHWRSFEIRFFGVDRVAFLSARHPFRWFFQRLEVSDAEGRFLGAVQQRFAILTKRFDVENESGRVILEVVSPFWRLWTFPFRRPGGTQDAARVAKKWSGILFEGFTDRDNFLIELGNAEGDLELDENERRLVLAAAIFIDLQFFEAKAG